MPSDNFIPYLPKTFDAETASISLIYLVQNFLLLILSTYLWPEFSRTKIYPNSFLFSRVTFLTLVGVIQRYTEINIFSILNLEINKPLVETFGYFYYRGTAGALLVIFFVTQLTKLKFANSKKCRIPLILSLIITAGGILLTYSRFAILSLILYILLLAIFNFRYILRYKTTIFVLTLFGTLILGYLQPRLIRDFSIYKDDFLFLSVTQNKLREYK